MPNLDGLDATQLIRQGSPNAEVLIVTNHESLEAARLSAQAGASGYVTKSLIPRDLVPMVKEVMRKHAA
jgi:DNA-binding NarL/FixJ family response regulator